MVSFVSLRAKNLPARGEVAPQGSEGQHWGGQGAKSENRSAEPVEARGAGRSRGLVL